MAITAPPQTPLPLTAHWATLMWLLAVGAGVAETVVGAIAAVGDGISMPALVAQLAVRTVIYGALFVVIDRYFRHGVRWSRYLLAGLLGTVGLASLIYEPITWLANNNLTDLDWSAWFFISAPLRTIHLSALLAALFLSFRPETNHWFRH
jgi:hypothetical protein